MQALAIKIITQFGTMISNNTLIPKYPNKQQQKIHPYVVVVVVFLSFLTDGMLEDK